MSSHTRRIQFLRKGTVRLASCASPDCDRSSAFTRPARNLHLPPDPWNCNRRNPGRSPGPVPRKRASRRNHYAFTLEFAPHHEIQTSSMPTPRAEAARYRRACTIPPGTNQTCPASTGIGSKQASMASMSWRATISRHWALLGARWKPRRIFPRMPGTAAANYVRLQLPVWHPKLFLRQFSRGMNLGVKAHRGIEELGEKPKVWTHSYGKVS